MTVNEPSCTDETVLMAGDVGDSILMPDPLPSMASSSFSMSSAVSGSQNSSHSGSANIFSFSVGNFASTPSTQFICCSRNTSSKQLTDKWITGKIACTS